MMFLTQGIHFKSANAIFISSTIQMHLLKGIILPLILIFCQKMRTDFFIADAKSGMRALAKAGNDAKVIPLVTENTLVNASSKSARLSSYLKSTRINGLQRPDFRSILLLKSDFLLVGETTIMRLEEGYITVARVLHREGVLKIVQPPESYSTGCLWRKLYLPVDVPGLIIR